MFYLHCLVWFFCFSMCCGSLLGQDAPKTPIKSGVKLVTGDSTLAMNIRFRIQNRVGASINGDGDDPKLTRLDFRVRRVRIRLDGHVINPKIQYALQLSFSRSDQDWDNSGVPNILRDAMIFYLPNPNIRLGFGQGKLPGNRQRVISSGELQLVERSLLNARLNVDRDFGAFAHYRLRTGKAYWFIRGAVSSGEGRNQGASDSQDAANPGLCYTGRMEFLPLGLFTGRNDYSEGDQEREEKAKISLAGGASFNDNAVRSGGQVGSSLYQARDITTLIFDGVFKYRGYALSAEYMRRYTPSASSVTESDSGAKEYIYDGEGYNVQTSYLFKNNFELVGQYVKMVPLAETRQSSTLGNMVHQYTLGLNKYLKGHQVKLQLDGTYELLLSPIDAEFTSTNYYLRFQVELGI
jgi:phosphate-selective porin OprO/OprP